ncbi:MAG: DUF2461 domain-containing protein [Herminiimonas sp.]|nr:DUF2461 domain-containing protein [Herminiimonas sp.]
MHLRDLTQFLAELSENNNRAWFVMNKPRYDILREEFLALVTALIPPIAKFDPAIANCNPKKALFRINRDMRFSHDKTPYKTFFSASITSSGLKKPSQGGGPSYYFQINAQGNLLVAAGEWLPPANRLRAIRNRIRDEPARFAKISGNKAIGAHFGGLQEEGKLKRPPKGFDLDTPGLESIKLKHFIVWRETAIAGVMPEVLQKDVVAGFKIAQPLVTWLRETKTPVADEAT